MPPPLRTAADHGISYREMTSDDFAFTEALYISTRAEEVAMTGWPADAQRAFLVQQHGAQHRHYQLHYVPAEWLIIERDGERIGRLYLFESPSQIRIVEISLIEPARGHGMGGAILRDILDSAGASGKGVSAHVEKNNPARRLYQRLGFIVAGDAGAHDLLEFGMAESGD